ncbi:MAG: nuclear transport factor 2 family protein [Cyclobacteriaceae bacterium]
MRLLLSICISILFYVSSAQTNDKGEIMKVVNNVFDAMRTNDSTLLKACFVEDPTTFTVSRREGKTNFVRDNFQGFIDAVGRPKEEMWNEPIWNEKIQIDDDLASVWVDYAFYRGKDGDQFSHCGVDAFHLVKLEGNWKIFHLVDTRRRESCDVPDNIKP